MTITKIHVWSVANFLGLMGIATGTIKGVILPVLALVGAGALGDVDGGIAKVSGAVSADIGGHCRIWNRRLGRRSGLRLDGQLGA